jgi:hypothetical protein
MKRPTTGKQRLHAPPDPGKRHAVMLQSPLSRRSGVALTGLALLVLGCQREDNRRCQEAIAAAQSTSTSSDLAAARQAIEAARAACTEKHAYAIDRVEMTIATREKAEREASERRAAEETRKREEPLSGFVSSVRKHRDATPQASSNIRCLPRTDPDFGFCDGTVDGAAYALRYWKDDPRAFRFSTRIDTPAVCDDLGTQRLVRSWTSPAGESRSHCEIYGGGLKGLSALITVSAAGASDVLVFSKPYLTRDPALRERLAREGR